MALAKHSQGLKFTGFKWCGADLKLSSYVIGICALLWNLPIPNGLSPEAWHLFAVFVTTIIAIIAKPMPMGAIAILAVSLLSITDTLTIQDSLSSFNSTIIWLVVIAFVLGRAFIKTGLGARISYHFVKLLGRNTLGLAYGLTITELVLSPFVPSNTARGGGIIYPIVSSLTNEFGSCPTKGTQKKIGSYLIKVCFQANTITSGMFLTSMAANPLIAAAASDLGYEITWMLWAKAAIVPGLCCLLLMPVLMFYLYAPELKKTPDAPKFAKEKLKEMGKISQSEIYMLITFVLLLFLWVAGPNLGINATAAAFVGLSILLFTGVLNWDDILNEKNAWNTFIWLATLLMMSTYLNKLGFISWFSEHVKTYVMNFNMATALSIIVLVYYYSHYLFASMTAHVTSMFSALLAVGLGVGAPAYPYIMILAMLSSLFGGFTHYGTGSAPIYFGTNYVSVKEWWKIGAAFSVINLVIVVGVGSIWWKLIGLF